MTKPVRLIIDTDPGVDDVVAILMALAAPGAEVVGQMPASDGSDGGWVGRGVQAALLFAEAYNIIIPAWRRPSFFWITGRGVLRFV